MNASAGWIILFIVLGGALQSCGAAMNGQLNKHVASVGTVMTIYTGATLSLLVG